MEILKSDRQSWALTVRCNEKMDATEQDVLEFISNMQRKGAIIKDLVFEHDNGKTYKGIHAHGIVELKKGFYRKSFAMDGYHYQLKEIFDLNGWLQYINKHRKAEKVLKCEEEYIPTDEDIEDLRKYQESVLEQDYKGNIFLLKKKLSQTII